MLRNRLDHLFHQAPANLRVRDFSRLELDGDFDLIAILKELLGCPEAHLKVMFSSNGPHLDALEFLLLLLLVLFAVAFALLVFDLAVIAYPADRRLRGRSHFNQVQALFLSQRECIANAQNPDRLALFIDYAYIANTLITRPPQELLIDTKILVDRSLLQRLSTECDQFASGLGTGAGVVRRHVVYPNCASLSIANRYIPEDFTRIFGLSPVAPPPCGSAYSHLTRRGQRGLRV